MNACSHAFLGQHAGGSLCTRIRPEDIPAHVIELCQTLARHGRRGWVVGGCLRDLLRGQPASDWDLATDAPPEQVVKIFPRVIPTGIQHGTVTVRHRGSSYEVTTLRGEGAYSDGRRPDRVEYVSDIREDLSRRDFTINALAYDPVADQLEDPFDGLRDLEARKLRAVGEPERRFSEDGLRVLRAARFAATLEFELDQATEAAIAPTLSTFQRVSAERVRDEWLKAFKAREPSRAFRVMHRTGILAATYPALAELAEPVFAQALRAVDLAPRDPIVRLSALLYPLRGQAGVDDWLTRYRFANAERDRVLRLLRWARPDGCAEFTDADVRRYARQVGRASLDEVASFGITVGEAFRGSGAEAEQLAQRMRTLITPGTALTTRELALDGRALMTELTLKPGPMLGTLLDALLERVLDQPALNTREGLLDLARAEYEARAKKE
jgi:tRNA nucleotidyltransferase (CCA-adding enzyme)